MLKTKLLHPEILQALGSSGHGSQILIADGNYPYTTCSPQTAKKVFLNLTPGLVNVKDVLNVLVDMIPIESATVIVPPDGQKQEIHDEFKKVLPAEMILKELKRLDFYDAARSPNTSLVIATAEQRRFGNILLIIGVVKNS